MYANLLVKLKNGEELYAWLVEAVPRRGVLRVMLDGQDGSGKYAEPAGEREFFVHEVEKITASF